jgi:protein-disulfide isomerase
VIAAPQAPVEGLPQKNGQPSRSQIQRKGRLQVNAAVLVLILVTVAAGILVQRGMAGPGTPPYYGPYAPVTRTADNTVTMVQPGVTKPVLQVYEDFQCPICDEFEMANGGTIEKLAFQGQVKVVYHPFTIFVGSQPRQANSTRAWAAAKCVPASSWVRYHSLLYANQPSETAENGFPIPQLLALGRRIRLTSSAFTQCVTSQQYAAQLVPLSNRIVNGGVNATPTVRLNGHPVLLITLVSPNEVLSQLILAAH